MSPCEVQVSVHCRGKAEEGVETHIGIIKAIRNARSSDLSRALQISQVAGDAQFVPSNPYNQRYYVCGVPTVDRAGCLFRLPALF